MRARTLLTGLALGTMLGAAGPAPRVVQVSTIPPTLGLGTTSPAAANPGFAPAPVPNPDLFAPRTREQGGAALSPNLFSQSKTYHGEGFTPGSTVEGEQTKRIRPTPGMSLKVPLQ